MRVPRLRPLLAAGGVIAALLLAGASVAAPYMVAHSSMEPSIADGAVVLVDAAGPRVGALNRGDIVVFHPPVETYDGPPFIKRVVGLPGETVEIHDGVVVIDGRRLVEPYAQGATVIEGDAMTWTLPEGSVLLLGDNRENSWDSRSFGPVPVSAIVGRAWLAYGAGAAMTLLEDAPHARWLPRGDALLAHEGRERTPTATRGSP